MKRLTLLFSVLLLGLVSCDKGKLLDNLPPDTRISVSEINLIGEDRLRSEVTLHWFGTDKDGWVVGYELSNDGANWEYVTVQDSTFNFELPSGADTTDIDFYVRAIDNDGDVDESPAYLSVPIKNSSPVAIFDTIQTLPDTGYIVVTAFLDVNDLDGIDNLDSVFLRLNNGPWYPLSPDVNTVTLVPSDPAANGSISSNIYTGAAADLLPNQIPGLQLNGDNTFYLKARDIAGAESEIDTSTVVFIKNKTSDLLLIGGHSGGSSPTPLEVFTTALSTTSPNFDHIDLRINGGINIPTLWTPTFSFFINFYEQIFWYGDASEEGLNVLEGAAGAIQSYLSQDGKILINTSFPSTFDNESVVQEFTPVDSLSSSIGSVRLPTDSLVMPEPAFSNYDSLEASVFVGRATPFYVKSSAEVMFTAQLFTSNWVGPNTVAARTTNGDGNTNLVFISIELHQLNGRPAALENFFNQVLQNEFNW